MNAFDFKQGELTDKPNQYLLCPKDYCKAKPNQTSPVYDITAQKLAEIWQKIPLNQARVQLINHDQQSYSFFYVQKSKLFKFPDFISVQIIPLNESQSTIAIYSQAKYGYYDFEVNKKRVQHWLELLNQNIKAQ